MKLMKKISAILLSLCLLVPCFSMVASAEPTDGRISFTDPETAVGEYVEIRCVLRSTSGNMGEISVDLSYDESYLRFDSGDGVESSGDGALVCTASEDSAEVTFLAKFQALQEGTTKVEITGASVSDVNGNSLSLSQGNSTVKIAEGDPSKIEDTAPVSEAEDIQVDVGGVLYTLTDEFADADIPNGYARTQRSLDGEDRQMVENESGNVCLGYLKDEEGTGDFFLYNEENATFSPYAEISISDITSIVVLSDTSAVSLPNNYSEAKLSLNDKEFPVWQDTEKEGIYVIYAMSSAGETGYYQYDSVEGTYQRFEPAAVENEEAEAVTDTSSILGKIQNFVEGHLSLVILVVGIGGILGLLILIILAVKLHNRNAELDELYDEYGIDLEEDAEPVKKEKEAKKETKKEKRQKNVEPEEEFEEEEFEEVLEEEFEEEILEDNFEEVFEEVELAGEEFEEEDFEDYREPQLSEEKLDLEEEFTGFTERMDFTIDDLDELLGEKSEKKHGHVEDDDTFKIDFIDLD